MASEALLGKLNAQALSKALDHSNMTSQQSATSTQNSSFKDMMAAAENSGDEMTRMLGMGNTDVTPVNQVVALSGNDVPFTPGNVGIGVEQPDGSRKVLNMLADVNRGQLQMDSLVNHVLYSGKRFNNQELLVIQSHIFHFAQMTELTVKVAEHGISSVRSVLNTQVQ
ncbi:MAG: hypothetical protein HY465_03895 [Deltaproteobacteria bacterium]|nr:hypothetical protein [Deltaproteobacteria bacterium]